MSPTFRDEFVFVSPYCLGENGKKTKSLEALRQLTQARYEFLVQQLPMNQCLIIYVCEYLLFESYSCIDRSRTGVGTSFAGCQIVSILGFVDLDGVCHSYSAPWLQLRSSFQGEWACPVGPCLPLPSSIVLRLGRRNGLSFFSLLLLNEVKLSNLSGQSLEPIPGVSFRFGLM